ncbi:MAG TPA: hypothetical protein VGQ00_03695 [Candidatus Norongarragalinales archaeon]|jgi:HEAT repeat protein|nr:hypothetical protein [Candidatus Norongarragalinales archaeon]
MSKLERFLRTGHPKVVLRHVKRMKNPEIILLALKHENSKVREAVLERFEAMPDQELKAIIPIIARLLLSDSYLGVKFRDRASTVLAKTGSRALPHVNRMLRDERYYVKMNGLGVAELMGESARPLAKPIANILTMNHPSMQSQAARLLAKIGDPGVIPIIDKALRGPLTTTHISVPLTNPEKTAAKTEGQPLDVQSLIEKSARKEILQTRRKLVKMKK